MLTLSALPMIAIQALLALVAATPDVSEKGPTEPAIRAAISRSLPLLVAGAQGAVAHSRQCFMCHNQTLPLLALTTARDRGFALDGELLQSQLRFTADFLGKNKEKYLTGKGQGGQVDMAGYALWTLDLGGWKPDETTAAVVEYFLQYQSDSDHWKSVSNRPPSEKSPWTASYVALRGLTRFGGPEHRERIDQRRAQVRKWLLDTSPVDTEDRVFRLWALHEVEVAEGDLKRAGDELLGTQRPDGGWSQDSERDSDAYATGSALVALYETGQLKATDPIYQRGLKYLLGNQLEDGSWHVVSHSKPFQTYFESGYPHGPDQFISIAAAGWATTALALALPASEAPPAPRTIPAGATPRERFLKLIERPRVPLQAEDKTTNIHEGLTEIEFAFDSEAGQRVTGLLVKKSSLTGKRPVVIALHGTGGSKQSLKKLLAQIAGQDMLGVAIDGRFAGERAAGRAGSEAYRDAIFETWETGRGFPFLYDTTWDILRLLDVLEARPDVDPRQIGAIGFSKGGMELYLAAAADERLAAVVPCIGVQSFRWALDNDAWQSRIGTIQSAVDRAAADFNAKLDADFVRRFYDRVVPGVADEFDGPVMLPLIAPRPLLVINGELDDRTPVPGLEQCVNAARAAYKQADAESSFEFRLQPGVRHAVTPESQEYAIRWLVQALAKE